MRRIAVLTGVVTVTAASAWIYVSMFGDPRQQSQHAADEANNAPARAWAANDNGQDSTHRVTKQRSGSELDPFQVGRASSEPRSMLVRKQPADATLDRESPLQRRSEPPARTSQTAKDPLFVGSDNDIASSDSDTSEFPYEDVCRIYLLQNGVASRHAGAEIFFRMKDIVIEAVQDLGPWSGDYPPWAYAMTLVSSGGRQKAIYFGPATIRDGDRVAFINDPKIAQLMQGLQYARNGVGLISETDLAHELGTFACP